MTKAIVLAVTLLSVAIQVGACLLLEPQSTPLAPWTDSLSDRCTGAPIGCEVVVPSGRVMMSPTA